MTDGFDVFFWYILVPLGLVCYIVYLLSPDYAEERARKARALADMAEAEQRERFAKQDIPASIVPNVYWAETETKLRIALMEAESNIKLAYERGNSKKVLEFTEEKFLLQRKLEGLRTTSQKDSSET